MNLNRPKYRLIYSKRYWPKRLQLSLKIMEPQTEEFLKLINQAIEIAQQMCRDQQLKQPEFSYSQHLNGVLNVLQSLKNQTLTGNLESSGGSGTLGLARNVADWIEPLDSPLLHAVGLIEQYYQQHF